VTRRIAPGLALTLAAVAGFAVPASGVVHARPESGQYSGSIGNNGVPGQLEFQVTKSRKKLRNNIGTAPTGPNCKRDVAGYAIPYGPTPVRHGHFKDSARGYGAGATVTFAGRFVTKTKATGYLQVKFTKSKGCDNKVRFRATRAKSGAAVG
jgi:hypothetical protein